MTLVRERGAIVYVNGKKSTKSDLKFFSDFAIQNKKTRSR